MKKALITLLIISLTAFSGCDKTSPDPEPDPTPEKPTTNTVLQIDEVKACTFATYAKDEIAYVPQVEPYEVNIPIDDRKSGNVEIYDNYYLRSEIIPFLNKYAFVIDAQSYDNEFFPVYENNRYEKIANFITTDSALHTYHLFFNYLLEDLEKKELYDAAISLTDKMLEISKQQTDELKGTDYAEAAARNFAYFAVAKKLLEPEWELPNLHKEKVEAELELIKEKKGIAFSNILGTTDDKLKEDYSQYRPRGHYTKDERLQRYFEAMMWYGRMTFRLENNEETKSAMLITAALQTDKEAYKVWDFIFEPINFFVGEPDDLTYYEYSTVAEKVYGEDFTLEDIVGSSDEDFERLLTSISVMPNPKINSMPILAPSVEDNDVVEETKGFRVLGQRSTVDAMIFQKLIYREVDADPDDALRMLPKALDIPAVFGSEDAYEILIKEGDTEYENYKENFQKLKSHVASLTEETWGSNLYWAWMYTLKTLVEPYGEGYPSFMTNSEWKLKELVTFLASWTELKHDTILYAKQVYAEMGGGPEIFEEDDRGYVEPNPELYNRLKSMIRLTIEGLASRELLNDHNKDQLKKLEDMMEQLRDISIKELENTALTDEEHEFIRTYGGSLEHFFYETLSEEDRDKDLQELMNGNPTSIVADVATDPNGYVLEEGVGPVNKIYVVFPIDGELHIGIGGVFSHYEFKWPMDDRLTDEKWRKLLFPYSEPPYEKTSDFEAKIADWQKSFTLDREYY